MFEPLKDSTFLNSVIHFFQFYMKKVASLFGALLFVSQILVSCTPSESVIIEEPPPTIRVEDLSTPEGQNAVFTVTLSRKHEKDVTFHWTTEAGGTASSTLDYTASLGDVTIQAGAESAQITVPTLTDSVAEETETFKVRLSNPTNATFDRELATASLIDSDTKPNLSISDSVATEDSVASFTVSLDAPSEQIVTVNWSINHSQTSASDFVTTSGSLTFAPGTTSTAINLPLVDDLLDEENETYNVVLSSPTNATLGDASGAGQIVDNDNPPHLSLADVTIVEGATATVTVVLDQASGRNVSFDWATANGSAFAGSDYNSGSATAVMIPAGSTSANLTITSLEDLIDEVDENFTVTISNPTNATISDAVGAVNVIDNDSIPQLSISDVTIAEGGTATFTVSMDYVSGQDVTFNWTSSNNTAVAPVDYTTASGGETILAGSLSTTVSVSSLDDALDEINESFNVVISNPVNATILDATGSATLTDNDAPPSLSINDVTLTEGGFATFTVSLSAPSGQDVRFDWTTASGTATAGDDFATSSATSVLIPAGSTTSTVSVATIDDGLFENPESFTVTISNASNATVSDNIGIANLNDNDATPTLSIDDVSTTEGGNLVFTVSLSAPSGAPVSVDWSTADSSAIHAADYSSGSGTKTIPIGSTSTTITVTSLEDTKDESNETLTVHLATPLNATISDATGIGTINDNDAAPALSINDVTVTEGGLATFTVTQSAVSELAVTFNWTTSDGTAQHPGDYTSSSGTGVTIPAGGTSVTLTVPTNDDLVDENQESLTITLDTPANATLSDATGTLTINDNEAPPTLSISDVSITEGGTATLTISLSEPSALPVSVDWTSVNGTAIAGSDFTAGTGTVTLAAGATSTTVSLVSLENVIYESPETFTVVLSNPTSATLLDATGLVTINDNDTAPTLALDNQTTTEGTSASFTITLTGQTQLTTTVDVTSSGLTAISGADFAPVSQTLTFLAGETTKTVTVNTIDDASNENNETYSLTLSNPSQATVTTAVGTGTILDNDSAPSLTISDVAVAEGGTATLSISLSAASNLPVTVNWATSADSALTPDDFTTASGTATIAAGATSTTINVPIAADAINETSETFQVLLSAPTNASIADSTAIVTITDANTLPVLSISDVTVTEGSAATFTVSLNQTSGQTVTFNWATSNDSAAAGLDYVASSAAGVVIPAGSTTATITVNTTDDILDETAEAFFVTISSPSNATLGDPVGVATVNDNDTAPSLSISDVSTTEGGTLSFTVSLSSSSELPVTVNWATSNNTALSGSDYTAASGTVTITPGNTSALVQVVTIDDTKDEFTEDFIVTLSAPTNASIADATGSGSVNDNDADPSLSISDVTVTEGGSAVVTVTLSAISEKTVGFDWSTADGTATQPQDYTANAAAGATIAAGSTSTTITLATVDDVLDENVENLFVNLSNPTNATLSDSQSEITVNDNDSTPTLSVNDITVTEGGSATFTITLSASAGRAVTFDWSTTSLSASSGADFTGASGTGTIAAGATTTTVTVNSLEDLLDEATETFQIDLANPVNASFSDSTGIGTITDNDATPSLSINDVTVTEAGTATFTVSLSAASGQAVSFDWATSSGTATSGTDFTAASGTTVTIPAGSTTTTLSVVTLADAKNEASENFNVTLSNPTNSTLSDPTGIGTITDDDSVPTLSIADATVSEGGTATLTVTLSAVAGQTITVDWATTSGSATSGTDFTSSSGTLTFAEGSTTATLNVPTTSDSLDEPTEDFTVTLANPNNATISDGSATNTITDDDNPPTLSINDVTVTEGSNATFTVSLSAASGKAITFDWISAGGTALAGADYTSASGSGITIAPGATSTTLNIVSLEDLLDESSEDFSIVLSNPTNATLADATGVGSISDNDATPDLSIDDIMLTEGSGATFTLTLSAASGQSVTVDWATTSGSATSGTDFTTASGTATINAGSTTTTVTVPTTDDSLDEPSENFTVSLSSAVHANIADGTGLASLTDNDNPPTLSINDVTVTEGSTATFTITANAPSAYPMTVDWATSSGSATSGTDFTAASGTATIAAGATTTTVSVSTLDDSIDEVSEGFVVTLSNPSSSTLADNTGLGSITDNDSAPTLSINDITVTEGGVATLTVSLSSASTLPVSFDWTTVDGTALQGNDYTATAASAVTIAAGSTTATISFNTTDDALDESSEALSVLLTNPVNATFSDDTGAISLSDNDSPPSLSINDVTVTEAGTATFTISLNAVSGLPVTFDWATSSGTATSGTDFTAASGTTVTIPAGSTTTTVSVLTLSDALNESAENFNVTLSNPNNAAVSDATGVGTITDDDGSPTLSINDITVTEGGSATLTITLSAVSGQAVTVDWATASGSAVAGADFTAASGTATIAAGATTTTVSINTTDDSLDEPSEDFAVNLSSPTNAGISDSAGSISLTDNDSVPSLSINDVTVTEAGTATFTVSLSAASAYPISFDWATSSGTATSGTDFTAASGTTVTIPAGSTTTTLSVVTLADALNESAENFTVTLSNPTQSTISDPSGIGSITDDDGSPTLSIDDLTLTEGGTATFTITLSAPSGQAVTVDWTTASGTAIAGTDFTGASGTATLAAGTTTTTVSVATTDDLSDEPAETFNLVLSNATHAGISDSSGLGTLNDNDNPPTLSINDVTITEGSTATFTVTASTTSALPITVDWATSNTTATAGSDYTAASGTATIAAGATTTTFSISTTDDSLDEILESFQVTLSSPTNSSLADNVGVGSITDNDSPPTLSIGDLTLTEGGIATLTVSLSTASSLPISFDWTTANGTATAPGDYTTTTGTGVTIAAGSTSTTISFNTVDDTVYESSESLSVLLSNPSNSTLADGTGAITLTDNESAPTLSINDVTVAEGGVATFTITQSTTSEFATTVNWTTSNGTAISASDYTSASGTATIAAGSTTTTVTVTSLSDTIDEIDEALTVNLSAPNGATLTDASGTLTITDDDAPPSLSLNDISVTEGGNGTFTISLSTASGQNVTVDWATSAATATPPGDYATASGTATITAGNTSTTVSVTTVDDSTDEATETFGINISNPTNATITDNTGIGTINDNDAAPTLTINDTSASEGASLSFTITLSTASEQNVTVDYASSSGTATSGADFTATSGTATILAGATTATITVPTNDGTRYEGNESFTMTLLNPSLATLADGTGIGTIIENDSAPTLSIDDITVSEGGSAVLTVTAIGDTDLNVQFSYATSDGTAAQPSDYTNTSGSGTIVAGVGTTTITIPTIDDTIDEPDQTFTVTISAPLHASISDASGSVTVTDNDSPPTLSINDVSATEGGNLSFTATLSASSEKTITFDWSTSDGTALQPGDYSTASAAGVSIAPGSTSSTITVPTIDDSIDENAETLTVTLANASNATISDASGVGTLNDNDTAPTLSIADATASEGGTLAFVVTLSAASELATSVNWTTAPGTALAGADFTAASGTLNIAAGATTGTINISTVENAAYENSEALTVVLSSPTNSTIADGSGAGTITDNDTAPTLAIDDVTVTEGGTATFTVTKTGSTEVDLTFDWTTVAGSAATPADFTSASGTAVTILAAATTTSFNVITVDDSLNEASETFTVALSNPTAATISDTTGIGTITDNDSAITLSINDVTVASEGQNAAFTVTLSTASGQPVSFDWTTNDGTATSPGEYTAASGTVTVPAGTTTSTLTIPTVDDATMCEPNKTFTVTLSNPVNASFTDSSGLGTIVDNDPTLAIADATASENGSATFNITMSASCPTGDVTFNYATSNGTALAGSDYTSTTGSITITSGNTTASVVVPHIDDSVVEATETYTVTLTSPVNAAFIDATATGNVTDNDSAPDITVSDATVTEAGNLAFAINLSTIAGSNITVNYTTSDSSASAGSDYTTTSGTATINAGSLSTTVNVPTLADALDETDETMTFSINTPSLGAITDASGVGTIQDNNSAPDISVDDVTVAENGTATFTVSLSAVSAKTVTFDWTANSGTAISGVDFTAASGTGVSIPAGSSGATFNVSPINDALAEDPETFSVTISNASNAGISDATGVGTINDNDTVPNITVDDVTIAEGGSATFTISLNTAAGTDVSVNWISGSNTALSGTDFTASSGTATITAGTTTTTVSVPTLQDAISESSETFVVTLSGATFGNITDSTGVGTITDDDGTPTLTINDVTTAENANATFTITLSNASSSNVTVNYATSSGTATSGADFVANSGTATIFAGSTTTTRTITVVNDTLDESNEDFTVTLSAPTGATLADATGVGTITDNDATPSLSINDVSIAEGGALTFTVTLSAASSNNVTFDWASSNVTATAGTDYTADSGSATILAGSTTTTLTLNTSDDAVDEANETLAITLSNPANATIADNTGLGTITDNDSAPTLSINDLTISEGGTANFTVTLSAASEQNVTFDWTTSSSTATSGVDFTAASGTTVMIPAGSTTTTVSVVGIDDSLDEASETFFVTLSNPTIATISDSTGIGTLTDNDATPSVSINDVTVTEGTAVTFTITLSTLSGQAVSVNWTSVDGTALAGTDYTAGSGTATIPAGSTTTSVTVNTTDDVTDENAENFSVTLSGPTNVTISDASGSATLNDNDAPPTLSINDVSATEGGALTFTVTLSAASSNNVTFDWASSNVTATAGTDYTAGSGSATILAGATSTTFTINTSDDAVDEANETLNITLSNPTNSSLADNIAIGTINDNDSAPNLSINDITVTEGGTASFTVTLSAASEQNVTFDWTTANVTATAGTDYTANSATAASIPAGSTTATVSITTIDDALDESSETYQVVLSNVSGANLIDSTGVGTLSDNDATPSLSINDVSVTEGGALTFTVSLSAASGQAVTFDWTTTDSTALSTSDYSAASASGVTIAAGVTTTTITITTTGDALAEANEQLFVNLSNATNATISDASGTGTINDNDTAPTLSINDVSVTEGASAAFTVTLSAASGSDVTVNWASSDSTAVAGADYTSASGTLTIPAGGTTGSISISTTDDADTETTAEAFTVTLSSPTNATLADASGTGTLTDNEPTKLSGTLQAAGDVQTFKMTPDASMAVFIADASTDGKNELYSVNADGTGLTKISAALVAGGNVQSFAISADSNTVVYLADQNTDGVNELFSVDISGGGVTRLNTALTAGKNVTQFAIAANSSKVVYIADESTIGEFQLHCVGINGTGHLQLNPALITGGDVTALRISENSTKVAYIADQSIDDEFELHAVNIDGSSPITVNPALVTGGDVTSFEFSPNSSKIVFIADLYTDENFELFSINTDGSSLATLNSSLTTGGDVQSFAITPNSSQVVYLSDEITDGVNELHSVNIGAGSNTVLSGTLTTNGNVTSYAVAANSSKVVYIADTNTDEVFELFSVNTSGTSNTSLAGALVAGGDVTNLTIAANSTKVAFVADKTTNNVFELYSVAISGGAVTKLNANLPTGGDVTGSVGILADSSKVLYIVDQITDELYELFAAPL